LFALLPPPQGLECKTRMSRINREVTVLGETTTRVDFDFAYPIKGLDTMLRFWNLQGLVKNKAAAKNATA